MLDLLQKFVDLGSIVVLPILIFVFGLILGTKPSKAFISALTVGVGFVGLNLVIDLLTNSLGPAAQAMVERFGLNLTTIDVGWPAAAAISYGTVLGSLAIPVAIVVNVLLIIVGLTKTLNVDIWNIWHAAFVASLVYAVTNDFAMGMLATVIYTMMILLFGDILGPIINKFYGFPNITFPHGTAAQKRFPGRELYIGMDAALSVGHPAVLSSSLILVPITILLAVILPGNTTLPFGDLATIPFLVCLMAAVFGGNIIRTILGGTIYMVTILYITSWVAPFLTKAAQAANFDLQGHSSVTAMAEGGLWTTLLYVGGAKLFGYFALVGIGLIITGLLFYVNRILPKRAAKQTEA